VVAVCVMGAGPGVGGCKSAGDATKQPQPEDVPELSDALMESGVTLYEWLAEALILHPDDCDAAADALAPFVEEHGAGIRAFNAAASGASEERIAEMRARYGERMAPVIEALVQVALPCEGHARFTEVMQGVMPPMTKQTEYPREP
jgi:hypothetical protein